MGFYVHRTCLLSAQSHRRGTWRIQVRKKPSFHHVQFHVLNFLSHTDIALIILLTWRILRISIPQCLAVVWWRREPLNSQVRYKLRVLIDMVAFKLPLCLLLWFSLLDRLLEEYCMWGRMMSTPRGPQNYDSYDCAILQSEVTWIWSCKASEFEIWCSSWIT